MQRKINQTMHHIFFLMCYKTKWALFLQVTCFKNQFMKHRCVESQKFGLMIHNSHDLSFLSTLALWGLYTFITLFYVFGSFFFVPFGTFFAKNSILTRTRTKALFKTFERGVACGKKTKKLLADTDAHNIIYLPYSMNM